MKAKRQAKDFWIALDGKVERCSALSTDYPSMWYVPSKNASLSIDVHLFESRFEANEKAHDTLDRIEESVKEKRRELIPRFVPIHY